MGQRHGRQRVQSSVHGVRRFSFSATYLDTISRLLSLAGAANVAVSAYTQVYMSAAHRLLRFPEKERSQVCMRLPAREPVVRFERNVHGHPLAGLLLEKLREAFTETKLRTFTHLRMSLCPSPISIILVRMKVGKKETLDRCGDHFTIKDIHLEDPILSVSQVFFLVGCTQRVTEVDHEANLF